MPPKYNPLKLNPLQLRTLTLFQAIAAIPGAAAQLPGGVGGSQVATFLVFRLIFGVEKEAAAIATIVLWLITFAGCSLAGLPLLLREGWSMGKLRQMARAEEQAGEAELLAEAEQGGELPAGWKEKS